MRTCFVVLPSIAEKGTEGCKDLMEDFAACVKNVAKGTSWVCCNLKCKDLTLLSTIQKYLHVKPFTQKALNKSFVFLTFPINYFSLSGPLHWVLQVPSIPSLHNSTGLDNINSDDGVTNFLLIQAGSSTPLPPPHPLSMLGVCGVSQSLHHSPCFSMSDRLEDRSSKLLACVINCKSDEYL